jgi:hypothetical protein
MFVRGEKGLSIVRTDTFLTPFRGMEHALGNAAFAVGKPGPEK